MSLNSTFVVATTTDQAANWSNKWNTFCTEETDLICEDIILSECPTCHEYAFILFAVLSAILATAILGGNVLVIAFARQNIKNKPYPLSYIKASLAIADILTGFQLFLITIPNIAWTLNSTSKQIYYETRDKVNSVPAYFGTSLFMLSIIASLYHLVLMSYNRFAAIKWPIKTKFQNPKLIYVQLAVVWLVSVIFSSYPAWFPEAFVFAYVYFQFLYMPNIRIDTLGQKFIAFGCLSIIIVAYVLMSTFTITTGGLIHSSARRARRLTATSVAESSLKNQLAAYRTLTLMEISFTVTLVPGVLAFGLSYVGYGNSIAILVGTYLVMCSGAANVAIYSIRDKEFRIFVMKIFVCKRKRSLNPIDSNQSSVTIYQISHSTKL